jgi:pimeloyl-ACP methyl ester carboxylesterase
MNSYFSSFAGANVRWFDFPGHGDPVVFIHGLGCASSYDYPAWRPIRLFPAGGPC